MNRLVRFGMGSFFCLMGINLTAFSAVGDTVLATSFEISGTPAFATGSINNQNLWSVTSGAADVVADPAYAYDGSNGLKFSTATSLLIKHTPFTGSVPGVTGTVYFDMYVKLIASLGKEFTINGYDLFGSSIKRTFVVDFTVPINDTGSIRIYNGSSKVRLSGYSLGSWYRISGKVDYSTAVYQVSVDADPSSAVAFRETYTPTASGTRLANVKEYHQLLFNLGSNSNTGTVDATIDQLYIGIVPIPDINFGDILLKYTVTVQQPVVGSISLNPSGGEYDEGTSVKATLTYPAGYKNYDWNGDVTGTADTVTFQVTRNMTIGAIVSIDSLNPPPLCKLTLHQPSVGFISLSPSAVSDSSYYSYTKITASLSLPSGYRNNGWTGALSGTGLSKSFTMTKDTMLGVDVQPLAAGTRKIFSSASAFKSAVLGASPGDTIELTDGIYNIGNCSPDSAVLIGIPTMPIVIRAQNRGKVELNGSSAFDFKFAEYTTVEGFVFTGNPGTVIRTECCNNIRITRNVFRLSETTSGKWILIGGRYNIARALSHHNRVDYNLFEEKHQLGNYVTIDGSPDGLGSPEATQYDRIDHNYFRNIGPRAANEMESVRIGQSTITHTSSYTVVENNLFEECDGDPEVVSVKTCDVIVRFNTFRRCEGALSLRQGKRTVAEGNFFFGGEKAGTAGIRVYGPDHKIYNNYLEGLTGTGYDAPLQLDGGETDTNGSSSSHWQVYRAQVLFNTFVNNVYGIEVGKNYSLAPIDCIIANNLIVGQTNALITHWKTPVNLQYQNNIAYPTASASLGISASSTEFQIINPNLVKVDSVWRLASNSPAIDAAASGFPYVTTDMDGQTRTGLYDIGADEYSSAPVLRRPLTPADVGPDAVEATVTSVRAESKSLQPTDFRLLQNYPNPFNPATVISYGLPVASMVALKVYDLLGREVAELVNEFKPAGVHSVQWNASGFGSGVYLCRLQCGQEVRTTKILLLR